MSAESKMGRSWGSLQRMWPIEELVLFVTKSLNHSSRQSQTNCVLESNDKVVREEKNGWRSLLSAIK